MNVNFVVKFFGKKRIHIWTNFGNAQWSQSWSWWKSKFILNLDDGMDEDIFTKYTQLIILRIQVCETLESTYSIIYRGDQRSLTRWWVSLTMSLIANFETFLVKSVALQVLVISCEFQERLWSIRVICEVSQRGTVGLIFLWENFVLRAALNMIFSVTYHLDLQIAISFHIWCEFLPSKVLNVL